MGKRNVVVVSSSEEDTDFGVRTRSTHRISSSKSNPGPSVTGATSRAPKRTRRRLSNSHSESQRPALGNFDALCEDFYDGFQECRKVTGRCPCSVYTLLRDRVITELKDIKYESGPQRKDSSELWVDKYRPQSLVELAVQKKKVEEVKIWLKERLITSKEKLYGHVLVITGQAGVGKSATIQVIASNLGARLCEWSTPTPTLWKEHIHNMNSGVHYTSKLDEFENFVERIRKYPLLPLSSTGRSTEPSILLIDDLPLTNGKQALSRLRSCLHTLVGSTQIPTVILVTECTKADSKNNSTRDWEDLHSSLEKAGACKMAFNPITVNSIKKTLSRICKEEHVDVTNEQIDQIAKASGGDIRHAITSLQYFCLTPGQLLSSSTSLFKHKADEFNLLDDGSALSFGRDETLSLFHALGKFLHNKRENVNISSLAHEPFLLSERFARLPLKMDAPEKILSQASGQARPIADFLHENVLDFLNDEAMDDASAVASYLCDADNLATFHGSQMSNIYESESIPQAASASVAVRGVLFGNAHPSQPRWHAIRSPKLWQVEQLARRNKNEMVRQKNGGLISCDLVVMATEYKPTLEWVGHNNGLEEDSKVCMMMDCDGPGPNGIEDDDDIEDW